MSLERETAHIFDLIFKRLMELSDVAIINFINGLFGEDHPLNSVVRRPKTETISEKLKRLMSDTIITINEKDAYHIEAETSSENIVVRVFEYGYAEAIRTKTTSYGGQEISLKFPDARIIYWESTGRAPDVVMLSLLFPDGSSHDYKVKTLKFLEREIRELAERKLVILLPFYVLKLRKRVAAARTKERRAELAAEMKFILDEVIEAVERSANEGLMSESDKRNVLEYTERMYKELFARYDELKEADVMLRERILTYSEEARQEGIEKGIEKGVEKVARSMLKRGMALPEIAEIVNLPIEKLKSLI
ncbi:MAG: hypothetical protein LBD04_02495 [Synergistaceae bacterium]|jgi:hypothetical protein|nr:hypothetical protein [Synergistaceae bacterium]